MRRPHRLALVIGGVLFAVAAFLVWFVPRQVNWDRYRSEVETLASSALGQDVRITGPIRVELLPHPVLTVGNVRVDNPGGNISIGARELRLRVGLGALLTGRLDPRELTLRRPDIRMSGPPSLLPRIWQNAMTTQIVNGTLAFRNTRITGINATLDTSDAHNGLAVRGDASLNEEPVAYTARLSPPDDTGTSVLEVQASGAENTRIAYSGTLTQTGALNGQVTAGGDNLSRLIGASAEPFQLQANLHGSTGNITLQPLSIQIDQDRLQGQMTLTAAPKLDITLAATQLDLAPWLELLTRNGTPGLPVSAELTAEAATLHDRLLRHVRLELDIDGDTAHLRRVSGTLPGDAQIELHDVTRQAGEQPVFTGTASIDAPTLRTTLDWIGFTQDWIPPEALRQAKLQGGFSIGPDTLTMSSISGTLDRVPVQGGIALRFADRLNASADLTLERLALDPWLNASPAPAKLLTDIDLSLRLRVPQAAFRGQTFTASELEFSSDAAALRVGRLVTHLANGSITLAGTYARTGQISDLSIKADMPDATALSHILPIGWRGPAALWSTPLHLQAQASGTMSALDLQARAELADMRVDTRLAADLNTPQASGALTVRHPNAPRLITLLAGLDPRENCNVQRECDIEKAGRSTWAWLGGGSLSLITQFSASPAKIAASYFTLSAGTLQTSGDLALTLEGRPTLSGTLSADTLPLPLQGAATPLPVAYLRSLNANVSLRAHTVLADMAHVLTDADATLKIQDGSLDIALRNATIDGGTLNGTAGLNVASGTPALSVEATLRSVNLASGMLPGLTGFADITARLTAGGHSAQAMQTSLSGAVDINVHDGILSGLSLMDALSATVQRPRAAAESALRLALAGGVTDFSQLSGKAVISNGIATLQDTSVATDHGSIGITGTIDLPRSTLNARLTVRPNLPDFPDIGLVLTGSQDAPQRRVDLTGFGRWFSQQ